MSRIAAHADRIRGVLSAESTTLLHRQLSHYRASSSTACQQTNLPDGPNLSDFIRQSLGATSPKVPQSSGSGSGRTVFIETYGCQQNVSDSEIVSSILASHGYHQACSPELADVVLLNTCSIREKAEARIFSRLGVLRDPGRTARPRADSPTQQQKGPVIGILGCMAERLKDKLLVREKLADLVVGPDAYRDLPRLITAAQGGGDGAVDAMNVQLSVEETYADITPVRPAGTKSAFLSIMRGCNNLCSFCIVPFTRGRERSRPLDSILGEVKLLSEQGVKELTLLGQNVNSYTDFSTSSPELAVKQQDPFGVYAKGFQSVYKPKRQGAVTFAQLLDAVASIDPEMRIWFTSPHPKDFSDEVLDVISRHHNIAKMIHMPAQSGSSRMLEVMRRGYTREAYNDLVQHIRQKIPSVTLSTDMIVGFCGESEEDHRDSMDLMRQTRFEQGFLFAYSLRGKTHAARHLQDDVPSDVKKRRLHEIIHLFRECQTENKSSERGNTHLVLVDSLTKDGQAWLGKTANLQKIRLPIESDAALKIEPGMYVACTVTGNQGATLLGDVLHRTSTRDFVNQFGSVLPGNALDLNCPSESETESAHASCVSVGVV